LDKLVAPMFPFTYAQLAPAVELDEAADAGAIANAPDSAEIARTDIMERISALCRFNIGIDANRGLISVRTC